MELGARRGRHDDARMNRTHDAIVSNRPDDPRFVAEPRRLSFCRLRPLGVLPPSCRKCHPRLAGCCPRSRATASTVPRAKPGC
ncbi:hypothetical protein E2562_028780 [Oryza meyeriana var. granulata]|uniref:Uncharacterized protein n=1 Tax=Oryza meyeriana var. granulata TaxID=110450 RepID=A0A6G1FDA9_9ORYZ|nr:hypothetical protein E2562_028780 [Oryza meyeriana var. granulata]